MDEELNKLLKSRVDLLTKTIERHNQKMGNLHQEIAELREYIDSKLREKQRPAPQFSEVVVKNEALQILIVHLMEQNSRLAAKLEQLQKTVTELSAEPAGQTVRSPPQSKEDSTLMNIHEESEKEGFFTGFTLQKRTKPSSPPTTAIQLPPFHQASGPDPPEKPGPAEYYKTEDGRYGCLKCGLSYKHKGNLHKHTKYECSIEGTFQCTHCLMKFKQKDNLKRHMVNKRCHNRRNINWSIRNGLAENYETEDGKYGCLKCGSSYKHKENLYRHTKYECGVQAQFQCGDCLRKFSRKGNLKTHIVNKSCHNRRNLN